MHPLIIGLIILIIAGIVFFSRETPLGEDSRKTYLEDMTGFVEGRLEKMEQFDNSYQINFIYEGVEFSFEDIEEQIFNRRTTKGFLRAQTPLKITISFTEQSRTAIRSEITSLSDYSMVWAHKKAEIALPKALHDFHLYTNDPERTRELLADEKVTRVFTKFRNVDSRGHPVMSLDINNGAVTLRFQPPGNLRPSLSELQRDPHAIVKYLDDLLIVINKLKTLQEDL